MRYEAIRIKSEVGRCLLCHEAPCTKACPHGIRIERVMRALRFKNNLGSTRQLGSGNICVDCEAPCMAACNRKNLDRPVEITKIVKDIKNSHIKTQEKRPDLSIDFCGVHCENPFFLSSSVVGSNYEMVAKAFDMGWAGAAFKTIGLFLPDEASPRFAAMEKESTPFVGFKNI